MMMVKLYLVLAIHTSTIKSGCIVDGIASVLTTVAILLICKTTNGFNQRSPLRSNHCSPHRCLVMLGAVVRKTLIALYIMTEVGIKCPL